MPQPSGLRERKKLETRDAIIRVALELFDCKGFAQTTIAEIADIAHVSPRTVSSYFPAKEDLVFPNAAAAFDQLAERLDGRAPGQTTADALREWVTAILDDRGDELDARERLRRRVIDSDEHLQAYGKGVMARGEELLARALATDLGCRPGDLQARMASAATLAIFDVLGAETKDAPAPPAREEALALLDRALAFVDGGVRALQDRA